jgi:spore coat protein U-like protein
MTLRFSTRIACAAIVAASFGLTGSAFAAYKDGTLNVRLEIREGCSVFTSNANGTLDFGTWTGLTDSVEASTTFNVSCTDAGKTFNVGLDGGKNGTVDARKLQVGSDKAKTINYNLYVDSSHKKIWGNTSGTNTVQGVTKAAGANVPITVYGRVPEQAVPGGAGVYTDTVAVQITVN